MRTHYGEIKCTPDMHIIVVAIQRTPELNEMTFFFFFSSLCYCCSGRVVPLHKICRSFVVLFCIVVVAGCSLQRGVSAAYPCRAAIHGFRCEEIVMHSLAVASYKNQDKCVYCLQTLMICKSNIIFVRSREMWCTTTSVRCAFAVTATHTHLRMG